MGKPLIWDEENCELVRKYFGKKHPDEIAELINKNQKKKLVSFNIYPLKDKWGEIKGWKPPMAMIKGGQLMYTGGGGVIWEAIRQGIATKDDLKAYRYAKARESRKKRSALRKSAQQAVAGDAKSEVVKQETGA